MTANENGGCPEGQTADATDTVQGATTAYPNNNYPRPRGATPLFAEVTVIDARDLMTEPADMGDALALDAVNYEAPWRRYLATDSWPTWGIA